MPTRQLTPDLSETWHPQASLRVRREYVGEFAMGGAIVDFVPSRAIEGARRFRAHVPSVVFSSTGCHLALCSPFFAIVYDIKAEVALHLSPPEGKLFGHAPNLTDAYFTCGGVSIALDTMQPGLGVAASGNFPALPEGWSLDEMPPRPSR